MTAVLLTVLTLGFPNYTITNIDVEQPRFYVNGIFPTGVYPIPVIDGCIPNTVQIYRDPFGEVAHIALDYAHRKPYDPQLHGNKVNFLTPNKIRELTNKSKNSFSSRQPTAKVPTLAPRKIEITTPEPKITTPEPKITTPEPKITTPEPKITTPEPKIEPKPDNWIDQWLTSPSKIKGVPLTD